MFEDILVVVLVLAAVGGVLYLSYLFSRYVSKRSTSIIAAQYMKVVDRLVVGQDRYILIVEMQGTYSLVSVTAQEIKILKELDGFKETPSVQAPKTFSESFKTVLSNMMKKK